jgi:hypothetical protein
MTGAPRDIAAYQTVPRPPSPVELDTARLQAALADANLTIAYLRRSQAHAVGAAERAEVEAGRLREQVALLEAEKANRRRSAEG